MFVHFVLSTVVETLQLVLAPPSAAPKSQEFGQVSHWWTWRDPQLCLPMLSRTPPVCGYGYHGGMVFATKLAHSKPKVSQKLFKRGGHFFVFLLSSCLVQSFLRPIQGLGARVRRSHKSVRGTPQLQLDVSSSRKNQPTCSTQHPFQFLAQSLI